MTPDTLNLARQCCRRTVQIFGILLAILIFVQNVETIVRSLRLYPGAGTLVGSTGATEGAALGTFKLIRLEAGSPLARAGARAGDILVMDSPMIGMAGLSTSVPVEATIVGKSKSTHVRVTPAPLGGEPSIIRALLALSFIVCDLLAAFLLVCSRGRTSALELGIALAAFAAPSAYVYPLLAGHEFWRWPAGVTLAATHVIAAVGFLAFGVRMRTLASGLTSRSTVLAAVIVAMISTVLAFGDRTGLSQSLTANALLRQPAILTSDILPLLTTLIILIAACRRANAGSWRRYATLIFGIGMIVFSQLVTDIGSAIGSQSMYSAGMILQIVASILGAGLMTYGVFGQRVIDVGLALNRTLVYGLISLILLVCFGLMEWTVNFLAPIHDRGSNVALGAGLALVVSLAFRRVHNFVERTVEQLFFRSWRAREDELRSFLREAPFFHQSEALTAAALTALRRFAEETSVAIYRRQADGDFARLEGCVDGFPDVLDGDLEILVRLRAEGKPLRAGPASLVLPMTTRNELKGAVILGCRADGAAWRPDQIAELAGATRDIGQDLQMLEIDRLRANVADLSRKLASSHRPLLSAVLGPRG